MGDEVVVYDEHQHRGHCLNRTAALVWRHLDGRTSLRELVARLRSELGRDAGEDMVWLALEELDRARLLDGPLQLPEARGVSRRRMLRRLGVAAGGGAIVLPAISSILAPPVHAQASAVACTDVDVQCIVSGCANGCACQSTTEGTNVCIQPSCTGIACTSSAGCPAGTVCFTVDCCGTPTPQCIPLAPAGFVCGALPNLTPGRYSAP
jgi:hypothetical protein